MSASRSGPEGAANLVVFGITGDLARKMTFRALYRLEQRHLLPGLVVGMVGPGWDHERLVERARQSVAEANQAAGDDVEEPVLRRLLGRLRTVPGDYTEPETYQRLVEALGSDRRSVFYLAVPPALFATIARRLAEAGLVTGSQVMVEKPFGHDLASARALNEQLHEVLAEDQILRVDHFLGKEPLLDVQYLRFANTLFEPVWNRHHVAAVHVTMAENFGVEDRGSFYDATGALRDVVQNHLLQLIATMAMDPPSGATDDAVRDQKVDVFRAMPDADPAHYVRGQYRGYLDVDGVAEGSTTETYVALRVEIDNWRWSGVPFFVRAGKSLPSRVTEVRVLFHRPPRLAFLGEPTRPEPTQVVLRVDPDPGFQLVIQAKDPHRAAPRQVPLELLFAQALGRFDEPYERLLHAALVGDHSVFVREDAVEETWRILDPLVQEPPAVEPYEPGSWGPPSADTLLRGLSAWHHPWTAA